MRLSIAVNAVSFAYQPDKPALSDVSLSFGPGTTAIIGENGVGKTTLLKMLNGLLKPLFGTVSVGQMDTSTHSTSELARFVGLVFQNPDDQIFHSRVLDEVMFGPLNVGMSREEAEESAKAALQELSILETAEQNPYDLSYSDRKRICLASVLAMRTDALLFDEPTMSQDAEGVRLIGNVIARLRSEGKTVIAITHDMNFVGDLFDRVVVMAGGSVLADGRPEQVFENLEALDRAHVSPPVLVELGQSVGLSKTTVTMGDFVKTFLRDNFE